MYKCIQLSLILLLLSQCSVKQDTSSTDEQDKLKIAFVSYRTGSAEVFLMDTDGSDVEQITSSEENNSFPFQIDERTIGFTRTDSVGNSQKVKIDIYTKQEERINETPTLEGAKWEETSPNGEELAFVRSTDYSDRELYIYNSSKATEVKLTNKSVEDYKTLSVGFSWSGDNKKLLFLSGPDWLNQYLRIYDLETDSIQTITDRGYMNSGVRWLNDNKTIIANLKIINETMYEIYSIDTDTGNLNQLTSGINLHPDVSPDGEWIVFESQRHQNEGEVYIMRKDGSEQTRLTNTPNYNGRCTWFKL